MALTPKPSASLTSSAQVCTVAGVCHGFSVATPGTADVTVQLFDGADDTGTPLCPPLVTPAGETSGGDCHVVAFSAGLYVKITCTPTGVIAYYTQG